MRLPNCDLDFERRPYYTSTTMVMHARAYANTEEIYNTDLPESDIKSPREHYYAAHQLNSFRDQQKLIADRIRGLPKMPDVLDKVRVSSYAQSCYQQGVLKRQKKADEDLLRIYNILAVTTVLDSGTAARIAEQIVNIIKEP